MVTTPHWADGPPLSMVRSPSGVRLFTDPLAAVVRTGIPIWPPPEIVQKLSKSDAAARWPAETVAMVTARLDRYTALQSASSEDALTWSVFGPIIYAPSAVRERFVAALLARLGLADVDVTGATVWLWRRIPHPEKWVSGGPEIDVGIQTPDAVVLGEAKWLSKEGRGQGVRGDATQFGLRRRFCADASVRRIYSAATRFVVLGISLDGTLARTALPDAPADVMVRDVTWDQLYGMPEHPLREELTRYLRWKRKQSGLPVGAAAVESTESWGARA